MRIASAGGKFGWTAASTAMSASAVHHLDRRRDDARRDDLGHGGARGADRCRTRPAASARSRVVAGSARSTFVTTASVPSDADQHAEQIGTGRVGNRGCRCCTSSPLGSTASTLEHVMHGEAVFQAVRAAGVLGDVAADRADLLTRRIGRVVVAEGRDLPRDLEVGHARLHRDAPVRDVDVEHAIEPRETDDDAAWNRQCAAGEPAAVTARDERHVMPMAQPHDVACTCSADERQHDDGRRAAQMRKRRRTRMSAARAAR